MFEEPADEEEGLSPSNVTQWKRGGSRCSRRACHHGGDNGLVLAGVQRRRQADVVAPVGAVMNQMMQLRGSGRGKCQQKTRGHRAEQRAAGNSCTTGPPTHRRYRYQERRDSGSHGPDPSGAPTATQVHESARPACAQDPAPPAAPGLSLEGVHNTELELPALVGLEDRLEAATLPSRRPSRRSRSVDAASSCRPRRTTSTLVRSFNRRSSARIMRISPAGCPPRTPSV